MRRPARGAQAFARVYDVVRQIPPGQVCSYGTVAALAGSPHGARMVGWAMAACRLPDVPCHRVLHADGTTSAAFWEDGVDRQAQLLQAEGVRFLADGRVDMRRCGWMMA